MLVTGRVLGAMKHGGRGRIVSMSSGAGMFGLVGQAAYGATKSALLGMTLAIAAGGEARGVKANVVLPYAVTNPGRTSLPWPPEDLAAVRPRSTPEFVSPLVTYLMSDECEPSGAMYSALGGRYGRVAVSVGAGWISPDAGPPSADEIGRHFDEIDGLGDGSFPSSFEQELTSVAQGLRTMKPG
jgi:NAD(P)-dependent dehydrogenase (short-subunit alcohol dehydrogenase family)